MRTFPEYKRCLLTLNRSQDASNKRRKLDDAELDSGDDEGRPGRAEEEYDEPRTQIEREENILDVDIGRHAIPKPSDGEVRSG